MNKMDKERIAAAIEAILLKTDTDNLVDLWNYHLALNDSEDSLKVIYSIDTFKETMGDYTVQELIYKISRAPLSGDEISFYQIVEDDEFVFIGYDEVREYIDTKELADTMIETGDGFGDTLIQSIIDLVERED